jgi:hypothetical protein
VGAVIQSEHCTVPVIRHWNAALRVVRYLSGTLGYSITYRGDRDTKLQGYCDADYAGDTEDRRSVSGYMFFLGGGPISWNSTKQRCVSTSTTEAEYVALSEVSKQNQ